MVSLRSTFYNCSDSSYTTPKGLQFQLYCNKDRTNIGDIGNVGTDTVEECLDQCSTHAGGACGAAAFDSDLRKCYFKSANITATGAVDREHWTLGVANKTQYKPLSGTCNNNGQTQKANNSLPFTVYCGQTVVGSDVCPDSAPDCRSHTDSLQECLDICATMHPLCTGVAWDYAMTFGYVNCYPKNNPAQQFDDDRTPASGLHCAKAQLGSPSDDCLSRANGTAVASNNEMFQLNCNQDNRGSNVTVHHADSIDSCIDSCATYTRSDCSGVVFDASMANGYENCYLKFAFGVTDSMDGVTFAIKQTSPSGSHHKDSKAWIAGPVVGVVVAFLLAVAYWTWQWRRWQRKRRQEQNVQNHTLVEAQAWHRPELESTHAQKQEAESTNPKHEMEPRQEHEMETPAPVYEMDSGINGGQARKP